MPDNAAFWARLHGKDESLAAYFREHGYELPCSVPDDVYMRLYQEWEELWNGAERLMQRRGG